ncbi:UNVERIFIED_CONTAM: hypothetical protein Sindi_0473200, partial [Sesamum indicum]
MHFIGDGYFKGSRAEKAREYAQALFSLEHRSICAVDEYIYWFRKYFFQSGVATEVATNVLRKDMQSMEENADSLIQRESSKPRKRRKQNSDSYPKSSRRTFSRLRSWWSKSKARTYKSEQRTGPTRASSQGSRRTDARSTRRTPTRRAFRRAHTRTNGIFKDCNYWTCGLKGHISLDYPQKCGLRKFEAADDILDAVYYDELVPIYQFEDLPSDESVYEAEIETASDGSSTSQNNYNEGDKLQTSKSLSGFFSRMTV